MSVSETTTEPIKRKSAAKGEGAPEGAPPPLASSPLCGVVADAGLSPSCKSLASARIWAGSFVSRSIIGLPRP